MKSPPITRLVTLGIVAASFFGDCIHALGLEITNATRNASGQVVFNVVAGAGTTNTIEVSPTMGNWFPLASGVATNGLMPFVHPGSVFYDQLFYRVRSGPEIPAQTVSYGVNTNSRVFALLTPETGGQCQIFVNGGPIFTFSVPSNVVTEPTLISMTVVTNITPAPGSNAPVAVLLEPAGLQFGGVAQLEIRYPTNLAPGFNAGYTFGSDGKEFHLVPSTADSNRVVIHVRHFTGYGTAPITPQMSTALSSQTIRNAAQTLERNFATRLGESQLRQHRNPGTTDHRLSLDLHNMLEEYYETQLKPALDQAATDCDLATSAIGAARVFKSYYRVAYEPGGSHPGFYLAIIVERWDEIKTKVCAIINHCDSELDMRCVAGNYNYNDLVPHAVWYDKARRDWGCAGGGVSPMDRFRNCAADWYGTISFHSEGGVTNSNPLEGYYETGELRWHWDGHITNAIVSISDSNTFMIYGSLPVGTYAYERSYTHRLRARNCPTRAGEESTVTKTYHGLDAQDARFSIYVMNGVVLFVSVTPDPTGVELIREYGREETRVTKLNCDNSETIEYERTEESRGWDWPADAYGGKGCLHYDGQQIYGICTTTNAVTVGDVQVEATISTLTVGVRRR